MNISLEQTITNGIKTAANKYIVLFVNGILAFLSIVLAAITIIGLLAIPAIIGGYLYSFIRIARGEPAEIGDFFKAGFEVWGRLLGLTIVYAIGITLGFIFLILPGIFLAIVWMFSLYLMVDLKLGIEDSLKKSYELVINVAGFWKSFALVLILVFVNGILNLIPIIGIIWVIFGSPFITMIYIIYYNQALTNEDKQEAIT